jgi:hypothetical protein
MQNQINGSAILEQILNHKFKYEKLTNRQKWKLYNIAKWENIYNVKIRKG